jgi:DNA-3-methyladenine glycosylase II
MTSRLPSLQLELPVAGPFSLQASARFLEGFAPAGSHATAGDGLALAFPVEGDWRPAGAVVRQSGDRVTATVYGDAEPEAVRAQLMRRRCQSVEAIELVRSSVKTSAGVR